MSKRPSSADPDQSVTETADDDPFLSRWARRKRAVRAGADPDLDADAAGGEAAEATTDLVSGAPGDGTLPEAGEDEPPAALTDDDMPPVDAIDEDTDMSGFFSPKVSQAVKKAALKKFFHSPLFNIVDGLDDYDDDFRNFEALGDIITSDMRTQMDREAARVREAAEEETAEKHAESSASAEPEEVRGEERDADQEDGEVTEADGGDEPTRVSDDTGEQHVAAADTGVTREPGNKPVAGRGKLRPKGAADDQS